MRTRPIQNNFTAGEMSPRLLGRTDTSKYFNGCRTLENFRVHPHGGASFRPGTHFIAPVKDNAQEVVLIPFEFSDTQAYVLEFGNLYMRVYRNGGQVLDTSNRVTNGDFGVGIASWSDQSDGTGTITWDGGNQRLSLNGGGSGSTNQAIAEQAVTLPKADDLITVSFDSVVDGVRMVIGTATKTIDVFDSGNLTAGSHTFSFIAPSTTVYIGFYHAPSASGSAFVDNVVMNTPYEIATPFSAADALELQYAQSADVMWLTHRNHKPRKLTRSGHTAWTITNYAPANDPFTASGDYPRAVTFFQQRLYFGGTDNAPSKFWGSRSGDYEAMTIGTADADAFTFVVASGSGKVPVIQWLAGGDVLMIGTLGSPFIASGGNDQAITPTNINVIEQSGRGVDMQRPEVIDGSAIFVQRSKRKIREVGYLLQRDRYKATDITILSEHITLGGITQIAYQEDPDSTIWCVRGDGQLIGITYEPDQEVVGYHRHTFAGGGEVESIAVIPNSTGAELWLSIKRTINGSVVRYIEQMDTEAWRELPGSTTTELLEKMKQCFYVECGLSYSGAETDVIRGLDHLIGEEVALLVDGAVHPQKTVDSMGQVTLDYAGSVVHAGLPYNGTLKTLPAAPELKDGTAIGRVKGWSALSVLLHESMGGKIQGEDLLFRKGGDPMDAPPPLFTGTQDELDLGYDTEGSVTIEQDIPLPFTVLAITGQLEIGE